MSTLYTMRICDPFLRQMDAGELGMMNWQYISFAEIVSSLKFTQIFKNFRNLFYGFSNFLWWGGKGCNFSKKLAGGQSGTRLWDTAKYFHLYHFLKLFNSDCGSRLKSPGSGSEPRKKLDTDSAVKRFGVELYRMKVILIHQYTIIKIVEGLTMKLLWFGR